MKNKNRDKDRFLTRIRMPYEGVFSKMDKKARYKGIAKNQFIKKNKMRGIKASQSFTEIFSLLSQRSLHRYAITLYMYHKIIYNTTIN